MANRAWVFTLNGVQRSSEPTLDFTETPDVRYASWQLEQGENGNIHYQGYIELERPQRLSWMRSLIPGAHFEKRRGTRQQARDYSRKEDTRLEGPFEHGEWRAGGQGARTDLHEAVDILKETGSLKRVAEAAPTAFVKYHKGLTELKRVLTPVVHAPQHTLASFLPDPIPAETLARLSIVFIGPTNIGKTSFALAHFKAPLYVQHVDDLRSLDTEVHDGIVLDDMVFSHWPVQSVIHLVDLEHPSEIHCRYSNAMVPPRFPRIFCANSKDGLFYKLDQTDYRHRDAVDRRVMYVTFNDPLFNADRND